MEKKISTDSISSVNTAENSRNERLGITTSKSSLFFSSVNFSGLGDESLLQLFLAPYVDSIQNEHQLKLDDSLVYLQQKLFH